MLDGFVNWSPRLWDESGISRWRWFDGQIGKHFNCDFGQWGGNGVVYVVGETIHQHHCVKGQSEDSFIRRITMIWSRVGQVGLQGIWLAEP